MKRRLLIDALAFEYGKAFGYQEYVCNLLDYIYEHRKDILYERIILLCIDSQRDFFLNRYPKYIEIQSYKCHSVFKRLFIQSLLPFSLSLCKQDLVLFTANYSSLLKKSTQILVVHDLLFKRKELFPYKLMRIQRKLYLPISIKNSDKIIAISKFTADDIEHYYKKSQGKLEIIYNYFNFKKYPINKFTPSKENCFISVCSSALHKNTITVLKAFKKYCINDGTFDLILVGALKKNTLSFNYFEDLPSNIKSRIKIYDKITNDILADLYQKSNAYISASLFEGLGMPIVEAMYFNLPVILSDLPVFHEVSMDLGNYFNPLDEDTLVEKMFDVQNNKIQYHDTQEVVNNLYSEKNTSKKYIDLFNLLYINTQ